MTAESSTSKPELHAPKPPLDGFTKEELAARRLALRAACPDGIIVLRAASEDEAPPPGRYRQDSAFFYYTGLDTPEAMMVLLPADVPATAASRTHPADGKEFLYLPPRNPAREAWTGPKHGPSEELQQAIGFDKILDLSKVWGELIAWIQRCSVVYVRAPYGERARLSRDFVLMQRVQQLAPVVQFRDLGLQMGRQRIVKSTEEISRISEAVSVTVEAQRMARDLIARGDTSEYEVEAAIGSAFRRRNAIAAFAPIVGGGYYSTVLHYEENRMPLEHGHTVVVDIGARVGHYCGDVTRTYPVGGRFSDRQREIYSLVLAAYRQLVGGYRPGEETLDTLVFRCKQIFKDSVLLAAGADGEEKSMDNFLPHGVAHHLGLDVHDVGPREAPLRPGSVITVEPGLYLPAEGIGVRLEDDFLVTEKGLERLGPEAPIELADVEG